MAAQKVVLCHGVFDVLHLGHKRHLEEASSLGDRLVVSITPDEHVNKGAGRPVFTAEQRKEMLLALDCVDDVIISGPTARPAIEQIRPAVYVKGIDYENSTNPHHADDIKAVEALGGRVHITRTDKWSSSRIINGQRLSDEALRYLDWARTRGWMNQIREAFAKADKLNIVFVGETIVDEYRYVLPLAKPSKEFILATVEAKEPEHFLGGIMAASLHAEWANASVVTDDSQILRKTRYVDADFSRKLFEVYSARQVELTDERRGAFATKLFCGVKNADAVIVMDFGHGLIDAEDRRVIGGAKFLAVNAQTNAGNHGFNPVTNYLRADLVCIDLPEAQLAAGMQNETSVETLAREIAGQMPVDYLIVTQGKSGATPCWSKQLTKWATHSAPRVPSFATRAVDTIGAGDAFLAVAGPLVAAGLDLEAAAFCGNVAGGLKTDIVGHRRHVGRDELVQAIESLLK